MYSATGVGDSQIGGIIGDRVNTDKMDTYRPFVPFVFPSFRARQFMKHPV
jgi:hypothetical protein